MADDDNESIAHAGLVEIFGAITLTTPTWTIIRHPFEFDRFKTNSGAAIHYLYAAIGFLTLITYWTTTNPSDMAAGGDAAPMLDLANRAIAPLGPNAKLDGTDVLPVMLLFGNLISGFTAYFVCRWMARWAGIITTRAAAAETLAATAYSGGAISVIFGIFYLFGGLNMNDQSLPAYIVAGVTFFLLYCWGRWIRKIHGLVMKRVLGVMFPFGLAFLSLAVFAGVVYGVDMVIRAV